MCCCKATELDAIKTFFSPAVVKFEPLLRSMSLRLRKFASGQYRNNTWSLSAKRKLSELTKCVVFYSG